MTLLKFNNSEKNAIFRGRVELHIQILKVPDFFFFFFFHICNQMGLRIFSRNYLRSKSEKINLNFFCQFHFFLFQQIMYGHVALNSDFRRYQIY